jgi:hypothetical protein
MLLEIKLVVAHFQGKEFNPEWKLIKDVLYLG